jgi:hypothetical protein
MEIPLPPQQPQKVLTHQGTTTRGPIYIGKEVVPTGSTGSIEAPTTGQYAPPWPDRLSALGPRQVGPFSHCRDCESDPPPDRTVKLGPYAFTVPGDRGTWTAFGDTPLCPRHAARRLGVRP